MHRLTVDRMNWGASALISGVILASAFLTAEWRRLGPFHPWSQELAAYFSTARVRVAASGPPSTALAGNLYGVKQHSLGADRTLVSVYNRRTGKTVWTR